jgi:hypothetical protein
MKIRPVEAVFFHANGDTHDEANCRFSQTVLDSLNIV